jgi:PEP-CTERM motif
VIPDLAAIGTGPTNAEVDVYTGISSGPASFGSGVETPASDGTGDLAGLKGGFGSFLAVAAGYVSGSPLSDSSTYDSQTFSSLGVTPGVYKWTWGSGANQSFTLDIVAVPEPSTWAMMLLGFAGLGLMGLQSARRRAAAQ